MSAPATVEAYFDGLAPDRRARREVIRGAIREAAPDAVESLAYQMPAFRSHGGQFLVSYAAWKGHDSLFPASDAVVEALGGALVPHLAGKGTIRFELAAPVPADLIRRIVAVRLAENGSAEGR